MKWLNSFIKGLRHEQTIDLKTVKDKFNNFVTILDTNNRILKIISDMEEKSQGDYLFDINYVRDNLIRIDAGAEDMIDSIISLGGEKYDSLRRQKDMLDCSLGRFLPGNQAPKSDSFTIPLSAIDSSHACRVGGKNAQLGEIRTKIGLPTPDGFAITSWAYHYFMNTNDLRSRINQKIESLQIKCMNDLLRISDEIRQLITLSPIPDDLAKEIVKSSRMLEGEGAIGVALRSSAIGEDSTFSFAGQYASYLNVPKLRIVEYYHKIIASKFTPQAIYYALSHSLLEPELAMGVGCISMVDARSSGVVYTRDPVNPSSDCLLIHSILGLGKFLVDGTINPDVYRISRSDSKVVDRKLFAKPVRLVLKQNDGVTEEQVPPAEQSLGSIDDDEAASLAEYCLKIERHYGCPQDIEWAIDKSGRIFILQSRPLRLIEKKACSNSFDASGLTPIFCGGVTICPGAGSGPAYKASSLRDLAGVPENSILVTPNPFPGIVTVMNKVKAIVTCVGNVASHMATLAREYRVPALGNIEDAMSLEQGQVITVDAAEGRIYAGEHPDLIASRKLDEEYPSETGIVEILKQALAHVAPLNLVHPADEDFVAEKCTTYHDLIRFIHQKAMEEMFFGATHLGYKDQIYLRLKSKIPLTVNIIYIDRSPAEFEGRHEVVKEEIASEPMREFWRGVEDEGWPVPATRANMKGFMGVLATSMTRAEEPEFSENSFAVLSKEYMMLSIRMGYHYSTIEAVCTDEPSKNYIRMQYKDGGATIDRRMRRIKLIVNLLTTMGFEHSSRGDFLDTRIAYQDRKTMWHTLYLLGKISIKTKQLDMALSTDAIARWYTQDFKKSLGLAQKAEEIDNA
jgi:pyruvate,water dikinase